MIRTPFLLLFSLLAAAQTQPLNLKLDSGKTLQVTPVAPGIVRVRLGGTFAPSLMERYGITRASWPVEAYTASPASGETVLRTSTLALNIRNSDGRLALRDAAGKLLTPEIAPLAEVPRDRALKLAGQFTMNKDGGPILGDPGENRGARAATDEFTGTRGFALTARLQPGELFYGLGTASKQHIQLRGQAFYNFVRYKDDEQPVPFFMSTAGWGVFVNTSWRHYVDLGAANPDELFLFGPEGELDFFLIAGGSLPQLLDRYTQITGRPMLLPQWAYGLTFINHINADQREVLENARNFRQSGIPVDGFGLEPGWMKKSYDFTTKKEWNTDRFYIPEWLKGKWGRNQNFIGALSRRGFKLHLWLCSDYDLTGAEERDGSAPWFDHLKGFLDDGVVAWKLDPARFVDKADPHRKYANGRSEYEMHNLNSVLWPKQIAEGQRAYTGQRAMMQYCGAWAGTQRFSAQTVGDIGGGPDGLVWMLNAGLSGLMNTSADMWINRPALEQGFWPDGAGLHFGFLSPWSLIDGWAFTEQPWWSTEKIEAMVKDYARLRYRLMPYLYSTAHHGARTGMPILRAMPLMFPDDIALADATTEYMLGDSLLVTAYSPTVRFPKGRWIDYWTGREYTGPSEITYSIPANRGGGLFIRAGAILPNWPAVDYVGQKPIDKIDLDVYPEGDTQFTLYEDDGLSLDGPVTVTTIRCRRGQVIISPHPERFRVHIHNRETRRPAPASTKQ